ncbi:MAG: hypothetical protein R3A13_05355 [Bdellovibrionota bacterium]
MKPVRTFKSLELIVLGLLAALIVVLAFPVMRGENPQSIKTEQIEVLLP